MIYSSTILNTENGEFKVNYHEFKKGDCITLVKGEIDSEFQPVWNQYEFTRTLRPVK